MREKVSYLKVGGDISDEVSGEYGWLYTKSGHLYYLWWTAVYPDETSAVHHVRRSLWVSMIREAIAHNLDVEISTDDQYSGKVLTLRLYAP